MVCIFQFRLVAFQVLHNHIWWVPTGLHRTALDKLLGYEFMTAAPDTCCDSLASCSIFIHQTTIQRRHHLLQYVFEDLPGQDSYLHSAPPSLLLYFLLCINHPVLFLSSCRFCSRAKTCLILLVLSTEHRAQHTTGFCHITFKLNSTSCMLFWGTLLNFSISLYLHLNGVANVQYHSVVQRIKWDDAYEGSWHNSGHGEAPFTILPPRRQKLCVYWPLHHHNHKWCARHMFYKRMTD